MKEVFITGLGITSEYISDIKILNLINIDEFPKVKVPDNVQEILAKHNIFKSGNKISREDRTLLNSISQMAIDATVQSFNNYELNNVFTEDKKIEFPIFIASETPEYNLSALDSLLLDNNEDVVKCLMRLGDLKKHFNPLDMLRLLSTNPLYHISKLFGLQGGGYPIKRMSLSGLCALEEAYYQMKCNCKRALVVAVGNLTNPENICAFQKMGLIKTKENQIGIIPSFGAVSLILEREDDIEINSTKIFCKLRYVRSVYKNNSIVTKDDWIELLSSIKFRMGENVPYIVLYDNGVDVLSGPEKEAVMTIFPDSVCYSYKKYIGYTGKANNLLDLVLCLSDKRIPCGSDIIINGIGTSVGFGSIWIEKLHHV